PNRGSSAPGGRGAGPAEGCVGATRVAAEGADPHGAALVFRTLRQPTNRGEPGCRSGSLRTVSPGLRDRPQRGALPMLAAGWRASAVDRFVAGRGEGDGVRCWENRAARVAARL